MPISSLMGSSRVALSAYQSAIGTTSKNISNVGNPDYVRRRADVGSLISPTSGLAFREEDNIARLESGFIQRQLWYKNQFLGKYETDELVYSQIETLFNEPTNSGLASMMGEFWNAWNDLGNDPDSPIARTIVKDKGSLLANTFNQLSTDLNNMAVEVASDMRDTVEQVNNILHEIHTINETIAANFSYDLADSRDAALTKLSKIMNIEVHENADHQVSVSTGGSILVPLISGDFVNTLDLEVPKFSDYYKLEVSFSESGDPKAISGGALGSMIDVQNDRIPEILDELDNLAVTLASKVNELHSSGFDLNDNTGQNFFSDSVESAASFKVHDDILDDPNLIASSDIASEAGNGNMAIAISDLQNGLHIEGVKFTDYYSSTLSTVGSRVQEANFLRISQEKVVSSIQNHRDSISGVSLDEEMSNLIRYEQAYQAASRMISVADELVQSVLNLI